MDWTNDVLVAFILAQKPSDASADVGAQWDAFANSVSTVKMLDGTTVYGMLQRPGMFVSNFQKFLPSAADELVKAVLDAMIAHQSTSVSLETRRVFLSSSHCALCVVHFLCNTSTCVFALNRGSFGFLRLSFGHHENVQIYTVLLLWLQCRKQECLFSSVSSSYDGIDTVNLAKGTPSDHFVVCVTFFHNSNVHTYIPSASQKSTLLQVCNGDLHSCVSNPSALIVSTLYFH